MSVEFGFVTLHSSLHFLKAHPTGFEPAISSVTGKHVGPLHHGCNLKFSSGFDESKPMGKEGLEPPVACL